MLSGHGEGVTIVLFGPVVSPADSKSQSREVDIDLPPAVRVRVRYSTCVLQCIGECQPRSVKVTVRQVTAAESIGVHHLLVAGVQLSLHGSRGT